MKYQMQGYKLIIYKPDVIESQSKKEAERKMIRLVKKGKIEVKSENYFTESEIIK